MTDKLGEFPNWNASNTDATSSFQWFGDFLQSGLESIPELVGIHPSENTQQFRAKNPVSGIASEALGMMVPYFGWFKATKGVATFDKAVKTLGNMEKSPFLTGAAQEAARFLPFEAGRVGLSQAVGEKPLSDMLGEAGLNLAIGSGAAGILHGLAAAGTREATLKSVFPGMDIAMPLPLQLRKMREMVDAGLVTGEHKDRATAKILETASAIRAEEVPGNAKYVGKISIDVPEGRGADRELESQLNRLFYNKKSDDSILQSKRFVMAQKDFPTIEKWRAEAREAGLPDDFEPFGQYFRSISFKTEIDSAKQMTELKKLAEGHASGILTFEEYTKRAAKLADFSGSDKVAKEVDKRLTKNMEAIGQNWFMVKEAEDGLFVMARKYAGSPGAGSRADKWVLFKTDNPGKFVPDAEKWADLQVAKNSWMPAAKVAADGGQVYNTLSGMLKNIGFNDYMAVQHTGDVKFALAKLFPKNLRGPQKEAAMRLREGMLEYFAPRAAQFLKSARGNYVVQNTKFTFDAGDTLAQKMMYGEIKIDPGKNLLLNSVRQGDELVDGLRPIKTILDGLTDEQIGEKGLGYLIKHKVDPTMYAELQQKGIISPEVRKAAEELNAIADKHWADVNLTQLATGRPETKASKGNFGLMNTRDGDHRIVVRDEGGHAVGLVGGHTQKTAQSNAKKLAAENPGWRVAESFNASQMDNVPADVAPLINRPGYIHEGDRLRGFKGDLEAMDRKTLMEELERATYGRARMQADMSVEDLLSPHYAKLQIEDPHAYKMAVARWNDFAGRKSDFAKVQNRFVDQFMAPMLGGNSAEKIVRATNTSLFTLQLGAFKLSHPIAQAMTFIQTVIPEVSMIGTAPKESLGTYSYFAAGGEKGPAGAIGVLSPIKLMMKSVGEMRKPSPELTEAMGRAANERVISPQFVEEFFGESATKVSELRKAFSSIGDFGSWVKALSDFLPATTERMSRIHAFTVGHMVARDYLALTGESAYVFAKQFTEKTMYMYSAADRPRIFTTPAGSAMGLFKNWMFNYIASMAEYTGQGIKYNNWAPLLWQTAGTAAVGGVAATPLYWIADGFSRGFKDKSLLQLSYDSFGEKADGVMFGLPAILTGMSFYSNTSSPLANPIRDANQLFSVVAWDRMKHLGKGLGAAIDHWQATGEHPGSSAEAKGYLARAFAPTTLYRAMGAWDDRGIKSLGTGYPLMKNVSTSDRLLYTMGINPVEIDRNLAVAEELFQNKEKMKSQISSLSAAWATAQRSNDSQGMARIMQQAMLTGVDVSSVLRGAMIRLDKDRKDILERNFKPMQIRKFEQVLNQQNSE
jgi:hypothetical protein